MEKKTPEWWMQAAMKIIGYSGILTASVITSVLQIGYFPTLERISKASVKCDAAPQANISLLLPSERSERSA
jgi:hypothetical protein